MEKRFVNYLWKVVRRKNLGHQHRIGETSPAPTELLVGVVVGVEQGELLPAVNRVAGVVDIQRDRIRFPLSA
jgi:hypothetical protein